LPCSRAPALASRRPKGDAAEPARAAARTRPAAPGPLVPPQPDRRRTTDSATTTAPGLALSTPTASGVTIAELSGELDIACAPALREQLLGLLRPGSSRLVIDLSKVNHCDASGLAVLIGTGRRARFLGGFLRLAAVSPQVDQGLHITGLRQHLGVFPTVQAAAASPQNARGTQTMRR
jgi:anti-anti-sigma factor